jgi:Zn-dependent metalloprotease
MLTTKKRAAAWCAFLLSGLLGALGCGTPPQTQDADPQDSVLLQQSQDFLQSAQKSAGLDAKHGFSARAALQDEFQLNVRYDHLYNGVKIWGGDVIVHSAARGSFITGKLGEPINLDVRPSLSEKDIRALIDSDLKPKGPYASTPDVELVIYPQEVEQVRAVPMRGLGKELNAEDIEHVVVGHTLAYHAHAALENGAGETSHTDYLFDAHTGAIIKKWDSLMTAAATGTGNSEYSGSVSLGTNTVTSGWELRDVGRAMNFATYNLNHGTSGTGTIFTDADNTWGDGANYTSGGSTTSANGQTAGVDAHFGIAKTYDYYKNVHGRNGIDNANTATYNRVHYSTAYDNAFWDDTCFCMTYGDGSSFKVLTAIDVAGHEMTHGVTSRTAGLVYSGESGGLNESTSDIHGTMVEFYSRGGSGSTIGNTGGTWTIGEQLSSTPLRYMYKPSKDGTSPDAWSSGIGNLDVHYSSGASNRAFYFLSQGSSSTSTSDFYSPYLPGGMTGVGNDHAARIAYRALTVYMTSSTNYAAARTAFLNAASDLYGGTTSADYAAVENAWAAINVGAPHGGGGGGGGGSNLLLNPGFESGAVNWTQTAGVIGTSSGNTHGGTMVAWLDGYGTTHTDSVYQTVTIPSTVTSATLSFWLKITTAEAPGTAFDTLKVQIRNTSGTVLATLATYSNLNSGAYSQKSFNVTAYKGQTIQVYFVGTEDSSLATSFFIDDTSLATQ